MQRLFKFLGLVTLLAMALAACQPAATATPVPTAAPTAVPAKPTEVSFAGQTLQFLTIQPHNVAAQNLATWFEEETGATVNLVVVPYDNVIEKAVLDVTSGANQIDVIEYWYPGLGTLVENNVLDNLDQWYVDNAAMLQTDDYFEVYFDTFTQIDGHRWGIPYDGDMHVLWYYKPLLEKYSLQPPTTWEEYQNVCQTITEGEGGEAFGCAIMGAKIPLILIGSFLNRLAGEGGAFFDASGFPVINSPDAVRALEGMVAQSEFALPTVSAVAFDEALGGWFTGKVGMVEFWTDLGSMTQDPNSSSIVDQWGVVALPKGSGPNAAVSAPINAGFGIGVSAGAPNRDLAYAFLAFAARPDIVARYNTVVGGIDPVRKSTLDDPAYIAFVGEEVAGAIRAAHANAVPWPTDALWFQLQESLTDNLSLALIGDKTPDQALDDTQATWEELLAGAGN